MKIAFSPDQWRALDKTGWHKQIINYNRRYGFTKKIPQAIVTPGPAFLRPEDQKRFAKARKNDRKQPLLRTPHLSWVEVPQRLPYRRGDKDRNEDPALIYADSRFLEMVHVPLQQSLS